MSFGTREKMGSWAIVLFKGLCFFAALFVSLNVKSLADNGWSAFAFEASAAKPQEAVQKTTNNHSVYKLQDEGGQSVFASSVIRAGNDLYFLGPQCLWWCLGAKTPVQGEDILILRQIKAPANNELRVSWQEANDFVYLPQRQVIAVLDKSGDLFEYSLTASTEKRWSVLRANGSKLGPPDPEYISLCEADNSLLLLDPERNQIWLQSANTQNLQPLTAGVLSWKLKAGDTNLTDGIAIANAKDQIFVLRKSGLLTKYNINHDAKHHGSVRCYALGQISYKRPTKLKPTRLYVSGDGEVYVVERENNRVVRISGSQSSSFIFPATSNLRGMIKAGDGFWIIDGDHLVYKWNKMEETIAAKANPRNLDPRLQKLILPIAGQVLPGHAGVYPGARRLYRFGVHAGLDMFHQPGAKVHVTTGTPVRAACAGEVVRADLNYRDMNCATYNRVIRECFMAHQTSPKNEDLLRGCQVWIDSGNGLLTKYAHLDKANHNLHVGMNVRQGDYIGNVGVSGTGENLPGRARYPHLHFETWLDGKYLGYGLTPPETMSLFEDIFASGKK